MDKIALVTGANRGIGYATAKGLLEKGITVIATSRNASVKDSLLEKLLPYGQVYFYQLDVVDPSSILSTAAYTKEMFGKLDILINNAGINYDEHQNVANANIVEVKTTLETNFIGPWQVIQHFLPLLKSSERAAIVNVSSGAGSWKEQNGSTPAYSISKLALNCLTRAFAHQLAPAGIAVNAVCPGWVRSDMGGNDAPRSLEQGADTIIWAALLEDPQITAKFFKDRNEIPW